MGRETRHQCSSSNGNGDPSTQIKPPSSINCDITTSFSCNGKPIAILGNDCSNIGPSTITRTNSKGKSTVESKKSEVGPPGRFLIYHSNGDPTKMPRNSSNGDPTAVKRALQQEEMSSGNGNPTSAAFQLYFKDSNGEPTFLLHLPPKMLLR